HADESRIDRHVAVGMVVAHRLADDLGTLHTGGTGRQAQIVHRYENPSLGGLEPIPRVGECPADDDGHGVTEIGVFQLTFDVKRLDPVTASFWGSWGVVSRGWSGIS